MDTLNVRPHVGNPQEGEALRFGAVERVGRESWWRECELALVDWSMC
jgi:hypothetical protein